MNRLRGATAVAVALAMPVGLWAGEAIQFSNTRSHPDPSQKPTLPGASSRLGLKLDTYGPMDGAAPGLFRSNRRDPRAERKAQNAEDEKKNWMVLDRGQLDAEDEDPSGFGVKKYDLENKTTKRDYFFDPPEEKGDRLGHPRQQAGRFPGKNRNLPEGGSSEASRNLDQDDNDSKANQPVSKDGRPVGDHVSKDLDMKDLLAPGKANSIAPAEDRTTKLWKEILGSVGSGAASESRADGAGPRGDGSVADGFRPSASGPIPAQGSAFSVGSRNDFGARPAGGGSPSLSGSASVGSAAPMAPRVPDSSFNRPPAPPTADRVPTPSDSYGARSSSFGSGAAGSSFGQPPPRRPSSSSFEIPARPGYGGR